MVKKGVCVFGSPWTVQQEKSRSLDLPMCSDCGLVCELCKMFSCYDCISKIYAAIKEKKLHDTWCNNIQSYIEYKPVGVYRHQKGRCCKYKKKQEKLIHSSLCNSNHKSCNEGSAPAPDPASTSNTCHPRKRKESNRTKKEGIRNNSELLTRRKAHISRNLKL